MPMSLLIRVMRRSATALLLVAALQGATATGQALVVDQSLQLPSLAGGQHFDESLGSIVPPTGQEFTPTFDGLDFVDVNLYSGRATQPGTFQIAIHDGTITGPT